jgi:uncharacterized protein (DUF4415 family)
VTNDLTDWARLDAMTDQDIERAAASDPDNPIVEKIDWTQARLVVPVRKELLTLRLDPEVITWFRSQGPGHLKRINAVLRNYYEAHRES